MTGFRDPQLVALVGGVLALLVVATLLGIALSRTVRSDTGRATVANLNARVRAWWMMVVVFTAAIWAGRIGSTPSCSSPCPTSSPGGPSGSWSARRRFTGA